MRLTVLFLGLCLWPGLLLAQDAPAISPRMPVAVIDQGIDVTHPELADSILTDENGKKLGRGFDRYYPVSAWNGKSNDSVMPVDAKDVHGTYVRSII